MTLRDREPLVWPVGNRPDPTPASRPRSAMRLAASFAASAGRSDALADLWQEACATAASGVGTEFATLLVRDGGNDDFLLVAGVGWRHGVVGHARLRADDATAPGFAWHNGDPVMSDPPGVDRRFAVPAVMVDHGVVRSLHVPVTGTDGAIGVLGVESSCHGRFLPDDVHFVGLLACSLASAHQRLRSSRTGKGDDARAAMHGELQHRINNDLQSICCSIARESRAAVDGRDRAGFDRVSRQVLAIADLHRHLRIGGADDGVDAEVVLGDLCRRIRVAADLDARGITLGVALDPVRLSARRAGWLAIAANELVVNAAEHAFPTGGGTVALRLSRTVGSGGALTTLVVSDDGCGFGPVRAGRAGLRHVERAVENAGGVLVRVDGPGTTWRITLASG